jgi:hypothetical protein
MIFSRKLIDSLVTLTAFQYVTKEMTQRSKTRSPSTWFRIKEIPHSLSQSRDKEPKQKWSFHEASVTRQVGIMNLAADSESMGPMISQVIVNNLYVT